MTHQDSRQLTTAFIEMLSEDFTPLRDFIMRERAHLLSGSANNEIFDRLRHVLGAQRPDSATVSTLDSTFFTLLITPTLDTWGSP